MSVKCILFEQQTEVEIESFELLDIEITSPPDKIEYNSGEQFDSTGMIVIAKYGFKGQSVIEVEITGYSVDPITLKDGDNRITVTYQEGVVTKTAFYPIVVNKVFVRYEVESGPTKLDYTYLDSIDLAGMVVNKVYSDGSKEAVDISELRSDPQVCNTVGTIDVHIFHEDTEIYELIIIVLKKQVPKPVWKETHKLVYNGNLYTVDSSYYWYNYDLNYMNMWGTTGAVNAGEYNVTCSLTKDGYEWEDGTKDPVTVYWSIGKASRTLRLSPSTLNMIGAGPSTVVLNYTTDSKLDTIDIKKAEDFAGQVEFSIADDAKSLSVSGDGSTEASGKCTIAVRESSNYFECSAVLTINIVYLFDWGDENAVGDATWWADLRTAVLNNRVDRSSCVGKQKKVVLTSAVLGTTEHMVRCIGADQDGNKTLTFQTSDLLEDLTYFNSNAGDSNDITSARYNDDNCLIRTECAKYYNAFPGKASIKQVSKMTSTFCNYKRNNPADSITIDYVWIPSEQEMGLDEYSPSREEHTQGCYNIGYSYYKDNNSRVKKRKDGYPMYYWIRTRFYSSGDTQGVCAITNTGKVDYAWYSYVERIAPAFVIG